MKRYLNVVKKTKRQNTGDDSGLFAKKKRKFFNKILKVIICQFFLPPAALTSWRLCDVDSYNDGAES